MKRLILFVAYYYAILLCADVFIFQVLTGVLYVVLISLPPFDILIVYACTYVCIHYAMLLVNPNFMYVTIKCLLTYLLCQSNIFVVQTHAKYKHKHQNNPSESSHFSSNSYNLHLLSIKAPYLTLSMNNYIRTYPMLYARPRNSILWSVITWCIHLNAPGKYCIAHSYRMLMHDYTPFSCFSWNQVSCWITY